MPVIDKEYNSNELIFNAEQTKQILHYFFPNDTQTLESIDCSRYSARNLAQGMLIDAVKASNGFSIIDRIKNFYSPSLVTELPGIIDVLKEAVEEGRFLDANKDIKNLKSLKIYDAIRNTSTRNHRFVFENLLIDQLSYNQTKNTDKNLAVDTKPTLAKNDITENVYSSPKAQKIFEQATNLFQQETIKVGMNSAEDLNNTSHVLTKLALQNNFENITHLSLDEDAKTINIADLGSERFLYANVDKNIAVKTPAEETIKNINTLEQENTQNQQNIQTQNQHQKQIQQMV